MTASDAALPSPAEILRQSGLSPKKSFGQHFLLDPSIVGRIAACAAPSADNTVIEIGPGPGGLTRALLQSEAAKVIAIEHDHRFVSALTPMVEAADGRLEVIDGDAVGMDLTALCPAPRQIVANLPYNVSTVLLTKWLETISNFDRMVLMFQKEVALRLTASRGEKAYGRLSVMTQWAGIVAYEFTVIAGSFAPPPKVDSAVVSITPRSGQRAVPWPVMEKVVGAAFGQRRKMLRRALRPLGDTEALLGKSEISPEARAEDLSVEEFERLAATFQAMAKSASR